MKLSKFFTISAATLTLASAGFVFNDFNAPKNTAQVGTFKYELSQKQGHIYFISDLKMKNAIGNKMRETDVRLDGKQGNEVAMDFKPYSSLEAMSKATKFNFSNQ